MIPTNLEKLILQEKASYQIFNHAWGMFGAIQIKPGFTAIITKIVWYPFINPIKKLGLAPPVTALTYKDLLNYNEYNLKIDAKKTVFNYPFRNRVSYKLTSPTASFQLNDVASDAFLQQFFFLENQHPIIIDTFQPCEEYIKLTIQRNAMITKFASIMGNVNKNANEQNSPNGVQNVGVLLDLFQGNPSGNQQHYNPPGNENDGIVVTTRNKENYHQDIYDVGVLSNNSAISEPQDMDHTHAQLPSLNPCATFPLCSVHYVLINKNAFDTLIGN